jgi:hypothetical protein
MTGAELVDSLGAIAGTLWIAGAIYWQLIAERDCPPRYSLGMLAIGSSLLLASSALVLGAMPQAAVLAGMLANIIMLVLAVIVHFYIADQLRPPPRKAA